MLLTAWLPGPHFRGQFIMKALKENIQKSKNPLVQQVEIWILERNLKMNLQIINEKLHKIFFFRDQLWLMAILRAVKEP